jgi:hypothetical protein
VSMLLHVTGELAGGQSCLELGALLLSVYARRQPRAVFNLLNHMRMAGGHSSHVRSWSCNEIGKSCCCLSVAVNGSSGVPPV